MTAWKHPEEKGKEGDAAPLLRLVVHVNKDGGRGDCSHGGTLEEGRVCRDQIRTQVRTEHSWGENIHIISVKENQCALSYISHFLYSCHDPYCLVNANSMPQVCKACFFFPRMSREKTSQHFESSRSTQTLSNFFHRLCCTTCDE